MQYRQPQTRMAAGSVNVRPATSLIGSPGGSFGTTSFRTAGSTAFGSTANSFGATSFPLSPSSVRSNVPGSGRIISSGARSISGYAAGSPIATQGRVISAGTAAPRVIQASSPQVLASSPMVSTVSGGSAYGQARVLAGGFSGSPQYITSSPTIMSSGYAPGIIQGTSAPRVISVQQAFPKPTPGDSKAAYEAKHSHDAQLSNLKELKKSCGLKKVPVMAAAQAFKAAAAETGTLTRDQFMAAKSALLASCGVEAPAPEVSNAVYDLFDRDDNGIVDMMEIVCGVSLLCKGSEAEKVEAVFLMFDDNGDGFVTMDEMYKFLNTVFKVVCTPNVMSVVNSVGVQVDSVEDMAQATATECFQTADLNHDGKLSLDEFKRWFYAPRDDPSVLFQPVKQMLN